MGLRVRTCAAEFSPKKRFLTGQKVKYCASIPAINLAESQLRCQSILTYGAWCSVMNPPSQLSKVLVFCLIWSIDTARDGTDPFQKSSSFNIKRRNDSGQTFIEVNLLFLKNIVFSTARAAHRFIEKLGIFRMKVNSGSHTGPFVLNLAGTYGYLESNGNKFPLCKQILLPPGFKTDSINQAAPDRPTLQEKAKLPWFRLYTTLRKRYFNCIPSA